MMLGDLGDLGDLGARVLKVEVPGTGETPAAGPPFVSPERAR
jgi:crotonobetainyl-CoA:carnitine CoA-transferase CaiB-like acyl-CoA transferase